MEAISYKLDQFEGPLDLLLTLISKNKIDIYDIPISLLCDQYMEYITAEENADLDSSSEFLLMASELMLIKSRMLLPKDEEAEDPRAALVEAMLEYKRAKEAAEKMGPLYTTYCFRMIKEQDEISVDRKYVADHDAAPAVERDSAAGDAGDQRVRLGCGDAEEPAEDSPRNRAYHGRHQGH